MTSNNNSNSTTDKNITKSLWRETAITPISYETLKDSIKADVTIIGAGFTGLRAALELSQEGLNVIVLESHEPGWGASGRNGGQVNPMAHEEPTAIIEHLGDTFGNRMVQNYVNSGNELFNLVNQHSLNCEATQNGWLRAGHTKPGTTQIQTMSESWAASGLNLSLVEGDELIRLTGSTSYKLASKVTSGGSVQPLSFARELARIASEKGASLFSQSPVQNIAKNDGRWQVTTPSGSINSEWVLFCTNAYSDNTLRGLNKSISPVVSVQAATRVLTDDEYAAILPEHNTLSDNRRVVYYTRKDNRNRLVFGCAGLSQYCNGSDQKRLQEGLTKVFPQFSAKDIEFYWGGRFAITPDGLPHLHEPEKGILTGLGYNGRGVAMATLMGRVLASRVIGTSQEDADIPTTPYSSFKFRPFHSIGLPAAVKYFEFRDAIENRFNR